MSAVPASAISLERDRALDGVRGFAVVMVLLIHCFQPVVEGPLSAYVRSVFSSMFIAVDLFFVLSGFLITSILIRTRDKPGYFRTFYWRRALRIMPLYALVLAWIFGIYPLLRSPEFAAEQRERFWLYVFYVQNFTGILTERAHWAGFYHLWSLAIEEQFYALWPIVLFFVPRRRVALACGLVCLAGIAVRFGFYFGGAGWNLLYAITPCRVDGLAAGGFIAAITQVHGARLPRVLHVVGAIGALGLVALVLLPTEGFKLFIPEMVVFHNTFGTLAFAWLIFLLVTGRDGSPLRAFFSLRTLRFLGVYSYGIYLLHWLVFVDLHKPLMQALQPALGATPASLLASVAVLSIAIPAAVFIFHALEAPALRLKDRVPGGIPQRGVRPVPVATRSPGEG